MIAGLAGGIPALAWLAWKRGKPGDPVPRAEPVLREGGLIEAFLVYVVYQCAAVGILYSGIASALWGTGEVPDPGDLPLAAALGVDFGGKVVAVAAFFLFRGLRRDRSPLGRPLPALPAVGAGALVALAFLPFMFAVGTLQAWIYEGLRWEPHPQELVLKGIHGPPGQFVLVAAFAVVVAPLFEEFLYRGLLHAGMRRSMGPGAAAILTSALFAASHMERDALAVLFVMGLFLSDLRERTGGLTAPIAMHACYNAYSMAGVWLARGSGG